MSTWYRRLPAAATVAVSVGAATALSALTAPAATAGATSREVVVTGQPGAMAEVRSAVVADGGQVRRVLPIVNGVAATVPASALPALLHSPGVRSVTADATGHLMGVDSTLGYDVSKDEGSLYDVAEITHAKDAWSHNFTGKGIDVALLDSGVSPVRGLASGNVVDGPDLSFESQDPSLTDLDTYGHGTFMASIIAGRDQQASGSTYSRQDSHLFTGIAPDARVISLKLASADGGVDVSQVIAAIDWVTEHAHTDGLNIRVLNLSFGTDSSQPVNVDPLDYAVENAWNAGITVVVSAGNDGTNRQALADPANDPLVIAVGADDPNNSDSVGDDSIPGFSQRGTNARRVDMIAPGVHLLGLRDPGSSIDANNQSAVVKGRFFRGSGTSQAAAVVSGLSALYLSRYPDATPDQVKYALMRSATMPNSVRAMYAGLGVPDVNKAIGAKLPSTAQAQQAATGDTGTGSLQAARGSSAVSDGTQDLAGETDIFGQQWDPATWAAASADGTAWSGGDWNGHTWTGSTWDGQNWAGHTWTDADWAGHTWTGHTWTGHSWTGHTWTGDGWDGHSWTDSSWHSSTWAGSTWSAAIWQ